MINRIIPVFATYNKAESCNIGFTAVYGGKELNLDSTSWCEARYHFVQRCGDRAYGCNFGIMIDTQWL